MKYAQAKQMRAMQMKTRLNAYARNYLFYLE